jgi:arginine/lysine/ornithine decarboxylase
VTNSVHKSLGGLNATALIHVGKKSRIAPQIVKDAYHLLNTTSPSPMILADVEGCVAAFVNEGEEKLSKAIEMNKYFRERI